MIVGTCVEKYTEGKKIIGYQISFEDGKTYYMTNRRLKELMRANALKLTNYTLTKDNRLLPKGKQEEKKEEFKDIEELKQYIGKLKLLGRVEEIQTCCKHICYLVNVNYLKHILYIPDTVEDLNSITLDFTKHIQDLKGTMYVYGGKGLQCTSNMFQNSCLSFVDFTHFRTDNVIAMNYMFAYSHIKILDLRTFNTEKVKEMMGMFSHCEAKQINLSSFKTPVLKNVKYMFQSCPIQEILDVSTLDTSNVIQMEGMFRSCTAKKIIFGDFNTQEVASMESMFNNCSAEELNLKSFKTDKVLNMRNMFFNCKAKHINVSTFNIKKVNDFRGMFSHCKLDILDLSTFKIINDKNVPNYYDIFKQSEIKKLIIPRDSNFITRDCYALMGTKKKFV